MGRLQDKRLFLLDMDGTIYLDDRLFDGVTAFLSRIREKGGRYLFLTNNSSKGVEGYIEKLNGMGIATGREDYLTSVDAAIDLLRRRYPGRRCYVQGTRSFYDQLAAAGIPVTCDREDGAEILLSGFDRELTFQKLEDACILLNRGVTWLAPSSTTSAKRTAIGTPILSPSALHGTSTLKSLPPATLTYLPNWKPLEPFPRAA